MDAEAARLTRRRVADPVVKDEILLAGHHLTGAAIGELAARGNGYELNPMPA